MPRGGAAGRAPGGGAGGTVAEPLPLDCRRRDATGQRGCDAVTRTSPATRPPSQEAASVVRRTSRSATTAVSGLDGLMESTARVRANSEQVIEGKPEPIRLALVVLLAEGHLLIED